MTHEERVKELERLSLSGDLSRADIYRHLKEVERQTAKNCADMIQDDSAFIIASEVLDKTPITALEFAQKIQRHILNNYLA